MRIEKKCWPKEFKQVMDGEKTFDMRLDDFECRRGDILVLKEWDPETEEYTGREIEKRISYVLHSKEAKFWKEKEKQEKGFVVMALREV